jgi:hypothetical protein
VYYFIDRFPKKFLDAMAIAIEMLHDGLSGS